MNGKLCQHAFGRDGKMLTTGADRSITLDRMEAYSRFTRYLKAISLGIKVSLYLLAHPLVNC